MQAVQQLAQQRLQVPACAANLTLLAAITVKPTFDTFTAHGVQGSSLDVRIKWPNDIYTNGMKIGGILCHSTYRSEEFQVVVGVGLNLDNSQPTTCVNDILRQQHAELQQQDALQPITREVLLVSAVACLLSDTFWKPIISMLHQLQGIQSRCLPSNPCLAIPTHSLPCAQISMHFRCHTK